MVRNYLHCLQDGLTKWTHIMNTENIPDKAFKYLEHGLMYFLMSVGF